MTRLNSTIVEFDIANRSHKTLQVEDLKIDPNDKNKIYWIHCDLNDSIVFQQVISKINLPENVINLCKQQDYIPKLVDTDEAITIRISCLLSNELNANISLEEEAFSNLIIHLSGRYCFTASTEQIPTLIEFNESYEKSLKYAKTPCFILFLILDNEVNDYAKILYQFEILADQLDLKMRSTHENIYSEVINVKNYMMKIKRNTVALREILMRISGRKISVISDQCRSSLYNLFNQSHMVFHEAESIRDILNDMLDQIDNALMQKMNETMRILTAFASVLLPLSLIAGIYGMNFHWIPGLEWEYGFFAIILVMVIVAAFLLLIFKKNKWF